MKQDELAECPRGRERWNESSMMARLRDGSLRLPPAQLCLVDYGLRAPQDRVGDGILEVTWRGRTQRYAMECKNRSTPQTIQLALLQARQYASEIGLLPMMIVPYLSDKTLAFLESEGVSGIDLSGNGVILTPDFTIWRSGQPNRYPEVQLIRNLYRGASATFVRCFLLRGRFDTLKALREYALSRLDRDEEPPSGGTKLSMGMASKVVQQLEEELLVRREGRGMRVLDAERLMDGLKTNYRPPEGARLVGKTSLSMEEIWLRLDDPQVAAKAALPWRYIATGLGSAARYHVLSGPDKLSLYVTDLDRAADLIDLRATRVFPNVELIEDRDDDVYFDARSDGTAVWASPVQTWLELTTGGPREREAAQALASALAESRGEQII